LRFVQSVHENPPSGKLEPGEFDRSGLGKLNSDRNDLGFERQKSMAIAEFIAHQPSCVLDFEVRFF
jgi:hypothetical protein